MPDTDLIRGTYVQWGGISDDPDGAAAHALARSMHHDTMAQLEQSRLEQCAAHAAAAARSAILGGASAQEAGAAVTAALGGGAPPLCDPAAPAHALHPGSGFYAPRKEA
ncbi:hypothetical protein [Variovorax rhizosphaerae]|uniref:Uncharacterized protein n=1 Tax=Variovorax rhizosphaerae TaxID=1836200 RepID=A0ABU8WJM8_9BURK